MPWVREAKSRWLGPLGEIPETHQTDPSFLREVIPAAFRLENTIGSLLSMGYPIRPGVQDPDYDPFADIQGYEESAAAFVHADSPEDVSRIKARIDREREDLATIGAAGPAGMAAMMAMGMLDPIVLVPVGTAAAGAKGVLKGGLVAARAGLLGSSMTEAALQMTQTERTATESAFAITAATLLSGMIGGTLRFLSPKQIRDAERLILEDLQEGYAKPTVYPKPHRIIVGQEAVAETAEELEAGIQISPSPRPIVAGGIAEDDIPLSEAAFRADTEGPVRDGPTATEEVAKPVIFRLDKILTVSPAARLSFRSLVGLSRRLVQELDDVPYFWTKNASNVANPISVHSLVRMWDTGLGTGLSEMERLFVKFRLGDARSKVPLRLRLLGIQARDLKDRPVDSLKIMSYRRFREEIGRAMFRGDIHPVPEIEEAARIFRREVFEPLKERAIELDLLPPDVDTKTAMSYLMRMWNREALNAKDDVIYRRTQIWLKYRYPEWDQEQVDQIARDIINRLKTLQPGRTGSGLDDLPPAHPLRERSFLIPDEDIKDFLEMDIEVVARAYVRTMAPEVEMTARFGDKNMGKQLEAVRDAYQRRVDDVQPGPRGDKERQILAKQRDSDLQDIKAIRDRILGTYGNPEDPSSKIVRVGRVVRQLNFVTVGGGFAISSIPDIGRVVMVHGVERTMGDGVKAMMRNMEAFKLSAYETKLAGTAWDMVLNTRAELLSDIGDSFSRYTAFERGLKSMTDNFAIFNLLAPWNASIKQFAGVVTQARMLDFASDIKAGRAVPAKEMEKLAQMGIDPKMARRIADQFDEFGETVDGIKLANTTAWMGTDEGRVVATAYRAALAKEVDTIIVTPSPGDLPLLMSSEMGKMVGQFRSFAFAAAQRVTMVAGQQRDQAVLNGLLLATALGMMVYAQKTLQAGKNPFMHGPRHWIVEGIDRSGTHGFLFDVNNIVEKLTRGTLGVSALTGGPMMSRYASRNWFGSFAGPTVGRAATLGQVTGAFFGMDIKDSDYKAMRRMIPYQNIFYLDWAFDLLENAMRQGGIALQREAPQ